MTIVGFPADVEAVYLGDDGILASGSEGSLAIDMTTSSPQMASGSPSRPPEQGVAVLDAPVSGGDTGARNATLSIMVGGDEAAFERARPLLDVMGSTVVLQGGPGAGPVHQDVQPDRHRLGDDRGQRVDALRPGRRTRPLTGVGAASRTVRQGRGR